MLSANVYEFLEESEEVVTAWFDLVQQSGMQHLLAAMPTEDKQEMIDIVLSINSPAIYDCLKLMLGFNVLSNYYSDNHDIIHRTLTECC